MPLLLSLGIARFTYVPDTYYDTVEVAFAGKSLAEWIPLVAHASLTLTIEKTESEKVLMKCLDGQDVRVCNPLRSANIHG